MPEQLLDDAKVRSALQEMGRERVAQGVGAHPVGQAGRGRGAFTGPRPLAGEATPRSPTNSGPPRSGITCAGQERSPRTVDPPRQHAERHVTDRYEALLVALADDPHEGSLEGQVLAVEAERLGDPKAGRRTGARGGPCPGGGRIVVRLPAGASRSRSTSSTVSVSGR